GLAIGGTLLDRILFERKLLRHLGAGQRWGPGLDLPHSIFNRLVNPDENWRVSEFEYANSVRGILNTSTACGTASPQLRLFHQIVAKRLGPDLFRPIEAAKVRLSEQERPEIRFACEAGSIIEPLSRADLRVLFREELASIRTLVCKTLAGAG